VLLIGLHVAVFSLRQCLLWWPISVQTTTSPEATSAVVSVSPLVVFCVKSLSQTVISYSSTGTSLLQHRLISCCVPLIFKQLHWLPVGQRILYKLSSVAQHSYDTIRYDSVYLTCSKKLTGSQLSLPHGINKKLKCKTKTKMMSVIGPAQSRYREAVQ